MDNLRECGGRIELIIGPMFSEKTTELISRVRRAAFANQTVTLIKFEGDTRYDAGEVVTTHSGIRQGAEEGVTIRVVAAKTLQSVDSAIAESVVIGIDEGQFYPDLITYCEKWANEGRRVIVAALDGDFARSSFGQVCSLIPMCESVEKRNGICMVCRDKNSAFTLRISKSMAVVEIGAGESYRTVCRQCHSKGGSA